MGKLLLKDALKASYKTKEEAEQTYNNHGYNFDKDLSNIHSRVYFNPDDKHLLVSYRGTHNLINDITLDWEILTNNLKNTDRYKHSKEVLDNKAKDKYKTSATIIGHSLGGSLASAVNSDDRDRIITFNKGAGLLHKSDQTKPNENAYRVNGDIESSLSSYDNNIKSLENTKHNPHFLNNLDNQPIYVKKNKISN